MARQTRRFRHTFARGVFLGTILACSTAFSAALPVQDTSPEDDAYLELDTTTYRAEGSAFVTGSVSEDQAIRMAKGVARTKVIEEALGVAIASDTLVRNFEFISQTVIGTARGITRNEKWVISRDLIGDTFIIKAQLEANVVELKQDDAPTVQAKLDRSFYNAGDEMKLTVQTGVDAYVAIYGRDAEDRVVRLYPTEVTEAKFLKIGDTLALPPDDMILTAEPRPDRERDEELLVVVASKRPFRADWLSTGTFALDYNVQAEMSVPYERFLDKVSELNLNFVTMVSVPYVVER